MVHGTHNAVDDPRNEYILVYINGELSPRQQAKISVFDSGYLVGDGVWAPHWYAGVHRSTGFQPYKSKSEPFPGRLKPLLQTCLPLYRQLADRAIAP